VEIWERSGNRKLMYDALAVRVLQLEAILDSARIPILLVLRNHDKVGWPDTEFITDIHMKRVEVAGRSFAGYRWTAMDRRVEDAEADMAERRNDGQGPGLRRERTHRPDRARPHMSLVRHFDEVLGSKLAAVNERIRNERIEEMRRELDFDSDLLLEELPGTE
jgi:hypothetical protein